MANANTVVPAFFANLTTANVATMWAGGNVSTFPILQYGNRTYYNFDFSQSGVYFFVFGGVTVKPAIPKGTNFPNAS